MRNHLSYHSRVVEAEMERDWMNCVESVCMSTKLTYKALDTCTTLATLHNGYCVSRTYNVSTDTKEDEETHNKRWSKVVCEETVTRPF